MSRPESELALEALFLVTGKKRLVRFSSLAWAFTSASAAIAAAERGLKLPLTEPGPEFGPEPERENGGTEPVARLGPTCGEALGEFDADDASLRPVLAAWTLSCSSWSLFTVQGFSREKWLSEKNTSHWSTAALTNQ